MVSINQACRELLAFVIVCSLRCWQSAVVVIVILITVACTAVPAGPVDENSSDPTVTEELPATEESSLESAISQFTCEGGGDVDLVCEAAEEGVIVILPPQGTEMKIEKLPLGELSDLTLEQDDFAPTRLVINHQIVDLQNNIVLKFDPPLKIQVNYTQQDVIDVGGPANLRLAFYDHIAQRWVVFTSDKHKFEPPVDEQGGSVMVEVPSWDDRHIAWGRAIGN